VIRQFEDRIPGERWVDIGAEDMREYQEMLRQVRIDLLSGKEQKNQLAAAVYHEDMMTILRKIRCYTNPGASECSDQDREYFRWGSSFGNKKAPHTRGFSDVTRALTGAVNDAAFAQVVGSQLNLDLVAGQDANVVLTHFS